MALIDLTGQTFGMLTVIERAPDHKQPNGRTVPAWRCVCECGNERVVVGSALRRGDTISCGCYKRPANSYKGAPINEAPIPKRPTIQGDLIIGRTYWIDKRFRKLVALYPTYARFQDEYGCHDCYLYWDLERMMRR